MASDDSASIRQLIDKAQIVDLVREYSYGVDHRLYDEVVELFTEDCVVDYAPGIEPVRSRAALREMFERSRGGFTATSHHNANVLVTFDGSDRASVRASVYAWHRRADGVTPQVWGYYHDTVVRVPEGWRFNSRQLRVLGVENWEMAMHPAVQPDGE